jgi:hypothetical protein
MIRLTIALTVALSLVSPAFASLSQRSPGLPLSMERQQGQAWKIEALVPARSSEPGIPTDYVMTAETEVLLNGKPCKYSAVPANASIVLMEVAADRKTVLKVHFRIVK